MNHYIKNCIVVLLIFPFWLSCATSFEKKSQVFSKRDFYESEKNRGRFTIGVWFEGSYLVIPPCPAKNSMDCAEEYYVKAFDDFKDMGINTVFVPNIPEEYLHRFLKAAERYDLRVIPEVARVTGVIRDKEYGKAREVIQSYINAFDKYKSLYGYYVIDEPMVEDIKGIELVNGIFAELDPKRSVYACLIGHKRAKPIIRSVRLATYLIDIYPLHGIKSMWGRTPEGDLSKSGWEKGSFGEVVSDYYGEAKGTPLWVVVQAFGHPEGFDAGKFTWREPTLGEIKLQVYEAIANGAKGIIFFVYQTEQNWIGLVDDKGKRTSKFEEVAQVSRFLNQNGAFLSEADRLETKIVKDEIRGTFFESAKGEKRMFILNKNLKSNVCGILSFDKDKPLRSVRITEIAGKSGPSAAQKVRDDKTSSFDFCLNGGDGSFFSF